jgi:hypothetical protein
MQHIDVLACYYFSPAILMNMVNTCYTTTACVTEGCMIDGSLSQLHSFIQRHIITVKCVKHTICVCHTRTN